MSQIHYREATLEDVILQSSHIIAVKPDSPPHSKQEMPIHEDKIKYPPFIKDIDHYRVLDTYKGSFIKVGDKISVSEADFDDKKRLQAMYYLEARKKSPIYSRYGEYGESNITDSDTSWIVFINKYDEKDFVYVMENAIENFKMKDTLLKMINSKK